MTTRLRSGATRIPEVAWVLALTFACLAPFLNKAYHIDDALFLWVGEHIQKHPADPFGFTVNWFGFSYPMVKSFENPPLACYYIALVASIAGWSELAMHATFLLAALASAWGIYSLARWYCKQPLVAAVTAVLTPVFLVSSTNVMCDVMLLAFWVWSLVFFEKGQEQNRPVLYFASGIAAALAVLTKFPGLALAPLLAACGLYRQRRIGWWLAAPVMPLLFAAAYEWWSRRMYGQGLLFAAATYASNEHRASEGLLPERLAVGLGFLGGSFLPSLFWAPFLWKRRTILIGLACFAPFLGLVTALGPWEHLVWWQGERFDWISFIQSAVFTVAGLHIVALAGTDFWKQRDSKALCLALWSAGIFVFATVVNWTMNGRSFLPMVPAVGILVARRLDQKTGGSAHEFSRLFLWPAIAAGALCLALVKADYDLAGVSRTAASRLWASYHNDGQTLWFRGHWGFQYYMEKLGAKPLDVLHPAVPRGSRVILPDPWTASNVYDVPAAAVRLIEVLEYRPNKFYATMSISAAAGFYTSRNGLLPFALGKVDPVRFYVFEAVNPSGKGGLSEKGESPGALEQQHSLEQETLRCQALIAHGPNDPAAHFRLGAALLGRARLDDAASEFSEVVRLKPDDTPAHLQLAVIASARQKTSEAIAQYRQALRFAPDSIEALNNLAWILATHPDIRFRDGSEAVGLAERANMLSLHTNAVVIGTLAAAYAEAGRFDEAVATANQAIQAAEKAPGDQQLAATNRSLLDLYRAKRTYRQQQ